MRIKEKDSQRVVIVPTLGERLLTIMIGLALTVPAILAAIPMSLYAEWDLLQFFVQPLQEILPILIFIAVVGGWIVLGKFFIDNGVILDSIRQNITVRKWHFSLIPLRRVIPFSDIKSVVIDYQQETTGSGQHESRSDAWKVSLYIGENKFKIDHTTNRKDMWNIASEISKYLGKELIDNSSKPESMWEREITPIVESIEKVERFFTRKKKTHHYDTKISGKEHEDNTKKHETPYKQEIDIDKQIDNATDRGRFRAG